MNRRWRLFCQSVTMWMIIMVAGLVGSCEPYVSAYLTTPPKMPEGYLMVYTHKYREILKKTPKKTPHDSQKTIIGHDVVRVGAVGPIIYGIRKHPATGKKTAFIVDANSGNATRGIPPTQLKARLEEKYQITNPPLVSSHQYKGNTDGGAR